jgi:hypothetical protein
VKRRYYPKGECELDVKFRRVIRNVVDRMQIPTCSNVITCTPFECPNIRCSVNMTTRTIYHQTLYPQIYLIISSHHLAQFLHTVVPASPLLSRALLSSAFLFQRRMMRDRKPKITPRVVRRARRTAIAMPTPSRPRGKLRRMCDGCGMASVKIFSVRPSVSRDLGKGESVTRFGSLDLQV